jgi:hypothetical protein
MSRGHAECKHLLNSAQQVRHSKSYLVSNKLARQGKGDPLMNPKTEEEQRQRAERGNMSHLDSLLGKRRRASEDDSILNRLVKRVVVCRLMIC